MCNLATCKRDDGIIAARLPLSRCWRNVRR